MRIVLSWLRESCPTDLSAEELADLLTRKGAEVEAIERPWEGLSGVVVARVLEVSDHPNSTKLCRARVDAGAGELEVVVGVRNMRPGDLVPLAAPGARVPVLPEPLGRREIRGVVSNGMLCSSRELAIADTHEGILILPSSFSPGDDLRSGLGLDDAVLDIEVTPNRPDFLSVLGIAREVAAATGVPFRAPATTVAEAGERASGAIDLQVLDPERCPRYLARVLEGVGSGPSPIAIQARLTAAGMRPISAVVDATNYVMLETGQPLHGFDLDRVAGARIVVRRATSGERLTTLDGVDRTLDPDDLLICDGDGPVAIAGVMGGSTSEVSDATTRILLEAASFERGGVQRTRRRVGLSTEASMRFERGVDPEAPPIAADRACHLLAAWTGASVRPGTVEVGGAPERRVVSVRPARASALLGYPVTIADALAVFDALGMAVRERKDALEVEVPGYRVDVEREADLVEEIVRVQGYGSVPSALPPVTQPGGVPDAYALVDRTRDALARAGLREVRQIPFVSAADLTISGPDTPVAVRNPLAAEEGHLRTSLVPGLLRTAARNLSRSVRGVALFEVGTVFRVLADGTADERRRVGLVLVGEVDPGLGQRAADALDAKGAVEALLRDLGADWTPGPAADAPFHPARSATVRIDGATVGAFGELHPRIAARFNLPGRVAVAELELAPLAAEGAATVVHELPRFPPVRRDLAFVVDRSVAAGAVERVIRAAGAPLVDSIVLFDRFEGPPLPSGKASLAYAVDFRAPDRTLTDAEAEEAVGRIRGRVAADLGGELRGGVAPH
ncbi:MAG: phenylalanine--tRNA ligase subunit beta [Actinomycetota bacterium]